MDNVHMDYPGGEPRASPIPGVRSPKLTAFKLLREQENADKCGSYRIIVPHFLYRANTFYR